MGIKQIIVCDGCDKELDKCKDRYYINFRTSRFLDAAGDTDYNVIDLVFCEQCAVSIKSTLNKILEKQKADAARRVGEERYLNCPKCGTGLIGEYCYECGQRTIKP